MAISVSQYHGMTRGSKHWLFRFSHTRRLALAVALAQPRAGEEILDFGGGDGYIVGELAKTCPDARYTILEPHRMPGLVEGSANIAWIESIGESGAKKFDKVLCFEVLEHLTPQGMDAFVAVCREHLRPGGTCIVSVPIEVGPPALFKYLLRLAAGRSHRNTAIGDVLNSAFFRSERVSRRIVEGYIRSHIGFDAFRTLGRLTTQVDFRLLRRVCSPLRGLPWFVNSQVYFVLERRAAAVPAAENVSSVHAGSA